MHPLHRERGNVLQDAGGFRRLRTPLRARDAAAPGESPSLGEHTREVLGEIGYAADASDARGKAGGGAGA